MSTSATHVEDTVIDILERVQEYLNEQENVSQSLSDGVFSLALARQQRGCFIARPDDLRNDLNPTTFINPATHELITPTDVSSRRNILLFCALPPPNLRKAQVAFAKALHHLVKASQQSTNLNKIINPIVSPALDAELEGDEKSEEESNQEQDAVPSGATHTSTHSVQPLTSGKDAPKEPTDRADGSEDEDDEDDEPAWQSFADFHDGDEDEEVSVVSDDDSI